MKSLRLFAFFAAASFHLGGCETTPDSAGTSSASPEAKPSTAAPSVATGKRLYYSRCTACHAPEPPGYYTKSEWKSMVSHMRERAKLTPSEERSILLFLYANAADS